MKRTHLAVFVATMLVMGGEAHAFGPASLGRDVMYSSAVTGVRVEQSLVKTGFVHPVNPLLSYGQSPLKDGSAGWIGVQRQASTEISMKIYSAVKTVVATSLATCSIVAFDWRFLSRL